LGKISDWKQLLDLVMDALPNGKRTGEQTLAIVGEDQDPASPIGAVVCNLDKSPSLERLQCGGQGGPVHRKQGCDGAHGWWLGAIQRHQERELAIGQAEGTENLVEAPAQHAGCTLDMKAETAVPNHNCCFVREAFFA
jgi:hypothetical protein